MVTVGSSYDFTSSLAASSVTTGWSSSTPARTGGGSITLASGVMRDVPATTYTNTSKYFSVTFGPADPTVTWTPKTLSFRASISHTSTTQFYRIATSKDGFASQPYYTPYLTYSMTQHTFDLTPLGQVTGPLTFRFYGQAGTTSAYLNVDDLTISGEYVPVGAVDVMLTPMAIGSVASVGVPNVDKALDQFIATSTISPSSVIGVPSVSVAQLTNLAVTASTILSSTTFGTATITAEQTQLPIPTKGLVNIPTSSTIATFADIPDGPNVQTTIDVVASFARSYTRGNGFDGDMVQKDIADVITVASIRLLANPDQLDVTVGNVRRGSFWQGWTLAEQIILNAYRKVAY